MTCGVKCGVRRLGGLWFSINAEYAGTGCSTGAGAGVGADVDEDAEDVEDPASACWIWSDISSMSMVPAADIACIAPSPPLHGDAPAHVVDGSCLAVHAHPEAAVKSDVDVERAGAVSAAGWLISWHRHVRLRQIYAVAARPACKQWPLADDAVDADRQLLR